MAYPVTLNGRTYTLADFEGTNYVEGLPDAFEDFVTHAGDIYNSTSTTSNTIGTGSKTFTVESAKPYQAGTPLRIADAAAPSTNFMDAIVTSYSGTTLVVDAVGYQGSGTLTSWNVNIGGSASVAGTLGIAQGGTGGSTAADARTNLDVYSKADADSRFLNVSGEASDVTMTGNVTIGNAAGDTLTVNATPSFATGFDVTGRVTADGFTTSASIISTSNSNDLGNTTIAALTADSLSTSGSITISGNSNTLGSTTVNGSFIVNGANVNVDDGYGYTWGSNAVQIYSNGSYMRFRTTNTDRIQITDGGDVQFFEDTGSTAKFLWDSSEESLMINYSGTSGAYAQLGAYDTSPTSKPEDTEQYYMHIDDSYLMKQIRKYSSGSVGTAGWYNVARIMEFGSWGRVTVALSGDFTADVCVIEYISSHNTALNNSYSGPMISAKAVSAHSSERFSEARILKDSTSGAYFVQVYLGTGLNSLTDGKSTHEVWPGMYGETGVENVYAIFNLYSGSGTTYAETKIQTNGHAFSGGGGIRSTANSTGNVREALVLSNDRSGAGTGSRISFHTSDAIFNAIDGVRPNAASGGHLRFHTMDTGGTLQERLRINDSGHATLLNPTSTNGRYIGITNSSGSTGWTFGNGVTSNAHQFEIYDNTNGATRFLIHPTGEVRHAANPAFLMHTTSTTTTTSSGAWANITMNNEAYDVGGNFSSNTFTAPVTGKYQMNVQLLVSAIDTAANYYVLDCSTSNRNYHYLFYPGNILSADTSFQFIWSFVADMDQGDTAFLRINQNGGTLNQTTVVADPNYTRWTGYMMG